MVHINLFQLEKLLYLNLYYWDIMETCCDHDEPIELFSANIYVIKKCSGRFMYLTYFQTLAEANTYVSNLPMCCLSCIFEGTLKSQFSVGEDKPMNIDNLKTYYDIVEESL